MSESHQEEDPESTERAEASNEASLDLGSEIRSYALRAALVVLAVIAVLATFQFYANTVQAINEWVAPEYRPIYRAAFNLVVVLAAGIGVSLVVRELTET